MSQGKILPQEIGLTGFKFDIALNLTRLHYIIEGKLDIPESSLLTILLKNLNHPRLTIGVEIIAFLFKYRSQLDIIESGGIFGQDLDLANKFFRLQEEHLLHNSPESVRSRSQELMKIADSKYNSIPNDLKLWYTLMIHMDRLFQEYTSCSSLSLSKHRQRLTSQSFSLIQSSFHPALRSMIIINLEESYWLISKDQFLMIHNKSHEIFNVLLIGWLFSGSAWSPDFYTRQNQLLRFMIKKVIRLKNRAYTLFKTFDGLSSAFILQREKLFKNNFQ